MCCKRLIVRINYKRLILAILYILSFFITVLLPNLFYAKHVMILAILSISLFPIADKGCIGSHEINDTLLIATAIGVIEACIGLLDWGCLPLTGTFDNPTLFSMAVSMSLPALLHFFDSKNKIIRIIVLFCFILMSIAIILSKSRTGILCMGITFFFLLKRMFKVNCSHFVGLSTILFVGLLIAMLYVKRSSTTGRSFILARSIDMIMDKPMGWGKDGFDKYYMEYQARFFKQNKDEQYSYLADDIRHPLNEFVLIAINCGITGLLLILLFIVSFMTWLYKKEIKEKSIIFVFAFILCMWALFAYPTELPFVGIFVCVYFMPLVYDTAYSPRQTIFLIMVGLVVTVGTIIDCKFRYDWEKGVNLCINGEYEESLSIMKKIEKYYSNNADFLYSYASILYNCALFEEVVSTLLLYKDYKNSYEAELMLAHSYMYMRKFVEAENAYLNAHYMCPVRFVPLYNLFKIYKQREDVEGMKEIGSQILSKEIKIYSPDIKIMKHNTRVELQKKLYQH